MTRRSKREVERALEDLAEDSPEEPATTVFDRAPDPLAEVLKNLTRDLILVFSDYPDEIANAPKPDATETYLEVVRDRYGIDEDRDAAVMRGLDDVTIIDMPDADSLTKFGCMAPDIAEQSEVADADGYSLAELVEAGREAEAEDLLVQATYHALAEQLEVRTDAGEPLADLVEDGQTEAAERLVVRATYGALAERGGEVTA